jgi:hypothetical protein
MRVGQREVANVQLLPPPQTAEAVRENLTWIREQMTTRMT